MDFPRGGGNELTPLEYRDITDKVKADLFNEDQTPQNKKKRAASTDEPKVSKKLKSISMMVFKNIHVGMQLIGIVKSINELDLTISLPNQLNGYVSITEINDYITTKVEQVAEDEEDTLPATVQSKEDHGYVIDFGIDGVSGFLSLKECKELPKDLLPGQIVNTVVMKSGQDKKIIPVSCGAKYLVDGNLPANTSLEIDQLIGGFAVQAKVSTVFENGVQVSFLGMFEGFVDHFHLGLEDDMDVEKNFKVGQKFRCRVLYYDPETKKIALTRLKHLLEWKTLIFEDEYKIGSIQKDITVLRHDDRVGLLVKFDDKRQGFVHISKLTDEKIEKVGKAYELGTQHTGRIIGYDHLSNLLILSFQSKVLSQSFVQLSDIEVGSKIKGKIVKVESFGIIVAVSDGINGLCPKVHLSDANITQPEKLFKVGSTMTFQVMSVDVDKKRLILTHKKSFLSNTTNQIVSYESAVAGETTTGIILAVKDFGCIVGFYNNVRAIAPISELSYGHIKNPEELFRVGQTVKCRILSANAENKKLRVSFKLSQVNEDMDIKTGMIVSCKYMSTTSDGVIVQFENTTNSGFIKKEHLSDIPSLSEKIFNGFRSLTSKKPFSLGEVMVSQIDVKNGRIYVTKKQSLMKYVKDNGFISSFEDLKEGRIIPGVVRNFTDKLCFIDMGDISVVANINSVSDKFIESFDGILTKGQTVLATVTHLDPTTERSFVSLKLSALQVYADFSSYEQTFLCSIFSGRQLIQSSAQDASAWVSKYQIGTVVTGTITENSPTGYLVSLPHKVTGMLLNRNSKLSIGEELDCQVIDVDINSRIADVVATEKSEVEIQLQLLKAKKSLNKLVDAEVIAVKDKYSIVRMDSLAGAVGFYFNQNVNSLTLNHSIAAVGDKLSLEVSSIKELESDLPRILLKSPKIAKPASSGKKGNSIEVGALVSGVINSVKSNMLKVKLADDTSAIIHFSEIYDSFDLIPDPAKSFKSFKRGDTVTARVIGFHNARSHAFVPLTQANASNSIVVELSIRPSILNLPSADVSSSIFTFDTVKIGGKYVGIVHKVEDSLLWVHIAPSILCRIDIFYISKDLDVVRDLKSHFKEGQALDCTVISKNVDKKLIGISLLGDSAQELKSGDIRVGRITKVDPRFGLTVLLAPNRFGNANVCELNDEFVDEPTSVYEVGQIIKTVILSSTSDKIDISVRKSLLDDPSLPIKSIKSFKEGDVVTGYIRKISENGCFVSLTSSIHARVQIRELSDLYIKDWKEIYHEGQLVKGKILNVNQSKKQIEMSLKESLINPSKSLVSFGDIKVKSIMNGTVVSIKDYGIFINLDGTRINGLCHLSEASDTPVKDLNRLYNIGDPVRTFVLRVDPSNKKVSLSLKASYFDESESKDEDMDVDEVEESDKEESEKEESDKEEESDEMEVDDEVLVQPTLSKQKEAKLAKKIELPSQALSLEGFSWDGNELPAVSDTSDDDSEEEVTEKPTKKNKKKEKVALEKRTAEQETMMLDNNTAPEMPEDFERLLLNSPNNSFLWIKYMAFQLELAETDKARQIAERALKTINFREEQERLNIFVAYLNLENKFGSEVSMNQIFEKACQVCDPKKIHIQLTQIYERNNQFTAAEELHKKMIKKFNESAKIWINFAAFYIRRNQAVEARELLSKSVLSLPKRKHIKMITKFGQLEYKFGEVERGRTVFEGLMTSYPKKADLWSVYLDMEVKVGDIDVCRRLFEQILQLKWSTKKMKKYLDFEKRKGTTEGVNHVKEAAIRYVETLN
ncbi:rRNA biogenesis protein rrp5 [Globomyces sp. JEL0801]|nr:rRNA biogenesis protein rrp5 [Globomyces sp. JEL0801]